MLSKSSPIQNLLDKQQRQQQASQANVMQNKDVFIKLLGVVSGNRSSIIYKIAFVWMYPWEFNLLLPSLTRVVSHFNLSVLAKKGFQLGSVVKWTTFLAPYIFWSRAKFSGFSGLDLVFKNYR